MLQLELLSRTLRTMMYYACTEKERFPVEAAKLRFVCEGTSDSSGPKLPVGTP